MKGSDISFVNSSSDLSESFVAKDSVMIQIQKSKKNIISLPAFPPPKIPTELDIDKNLEQLLVSFRRLCIDNQLNEKLHNSTLKNCSIHSNDYESINDTTNNKIVYESIPILFHENNEYVNIF